MSKYSTTKNNNIKKTNKPITQSIKNIINKIKSITIPKTYINLLFSFRLKIKGEDFT